MSQLLINLNDISYYFTFDEVIKMKKYIEKGAVIFITNKDIIDYPYYFTLLDFLKKSNKFVQRKVDSEFNILDPQLFDEYIRSFFSTHKLNYPQLSLNIIDFLDAVYEELGLADLVKEFRNGIIKKYIF